MSEKCSHYTPPENAQDFGVCAISRNGTYCISFPAEPTGCHRYQRARGDRWREIADELAEANTYCTNGSCKSTDCSSCRVVDAIQEYAEATK
jgi:hypothetical protein